jgi:cytochrome bd-type quinol oxidase subunit 1
LQNDTCHADAWLIWELIPNSLIQGSDMKTQEQTGIKQPVRKNRPIQVKKTALRAWMFPAVAVLMVLFLLTALVHTYLTYRRNMAEMDVLSRELVNLKSAMNIDSVRQYKIQKILAIIQEHNPAIS